MKRRHCRPPRPEIPRNHADQLVLVHERRRFRPKVWPPVQNPERQALEPLVLAWLRRITCPARAHAGAPGRRVAAWLGRHKVRLAVLVALVRLLQDPPTADDTMPLLLGILRVAIQVSVAGRRRQVERASLGPGYRYHLCGHVALFRRALRPGGG